MKLNNVRISAALLAVLLILPLVSWAQDNDLQTLVDELQTLTEKSRQERAADRWLQNAMEDLVAKYNFPWRSSLFSDDFSDGDYTSSPVWQVSTGQFWVDRRLGLRSQVNGHTAKVEDTSPQQRAPEKDLGRALLGALLQEALGPEKSQTDTTSRKQNPKSEAASIRTSVNIPTTFAVESVFSQNNRPGEEGQFAWIVMQDEHANNAYKVVVSSGGKAVLDVIRTRSGRDSYIQSVEVPTLNDGGEHALSWRQTAQGDIEIYLDAVSVVKTRDKAFRYGFKYLGMVNRVGDFSISGIEILGGK